MRKLKRVSTVIVLLGFTLCVLSCIEGYYYRVPPCKWSYGPFDGEVSSMAIGPDGTVYFRTHNEYASGDNHLHALTPEGTKKWSYRIEGWGKSSPAISSDGSIYFGSAGNLHALSSDGTLKWKYEGSSGTPAIDSDGTIYISASFQEDTLDYYYLYSLSPEGVLKWSYQTESWLETPPAIGSDGTIYFGTQRESYVELHAVNPDGTLKWLHQTGESDYYSSISSLAIGRDGTIYFGAVDGSNKGFFYAVSTDGSLKWCFKDDLFHVGSPAIDPDGTIYFLGCYGLYALNPDGSLKWRSPIDASCSSSPVIGSDGSIFFRGGRDFFAANPDGSVKWHYPIDGPTVGFTTAVSSDGTIYCASGGYYGGYLYALESESEGLAESPWPREGHDNRNTGQYGGP